ncbi:MAG TPA: MFS transporter [archaeon]|nr:MFS transporter [archaeon]
MTTFIQTEEQQKKDFKYSVMDGVFWTIMTYLGAVFLTPYLLSLGANSFQIGLTTYVPTLIASIICFFSYDFLKYFNSKRSFVVFFVIIQATLWIPLAFVYFFATGSTAVWFVLIIYFLISIIGTIPGPVYGDWIGKVFKIKEIGLYNARRNIICNLVTILPLFFAGSILDAASHSNTLFIFTIIFIFAGIFRFISAMSLNKMSITETKEEIKHETHQSKGLMLNAFRDEIKNNKNYVYFFVVVLFYYFSLYVTAPYNRFYLLEIAKLSYTQYISIEIVAILGVILTLFYWGTAVDKFGATRVLKATIFFLPLYPLTLILFSKNFYVLISLVFIDAVLTAGLGIALTSYLYQNIRKNLIAHMTFLTLFQSIALTLGALSAAGINYLLTKNLGSETRALFWVFIIGIGLRFISAILSQGLKDNNPEKTNVLKEIIVFKPIIYGGGKLMQIWGEKQKEITHNVGQRTKKIQLHLKKTTKQIKGDFSLTAKKFGKELNDTTEEIIHTTKKAIKRTKKFLDKKDDF